MARFTVRFDREASADLLSIRDHIAEVRGKAFAAEFTQRIVDYCESFAALPHRGTKRDKIMPGLRTVGWRRTVTIAFQVFEDERRVVILGVFYRGRDSLAEMRKRT
ncbi:MAG: type II toxin-antitoxin system RelE/ParE family toxin [Hyphomonadaceae bacterium]